MRKRKNSIRCRMDLVEAGTTRAAQELPKAVKADQRN
jgi:hypothetical protein